MGVEARRQDLGQYVGRQPGRQRRQDLRGRQRGGCAESAALEQDGNDRVREQDQPHRRRKSHEQASSRARFRTSWAARPLRAARLRAGNSTVPSATPDDPERQLHQTIGIEQIGDRASRQVGGEPAADQQIELDHAHPESAWPDQAQQPSHLGRQSWPAERRGEPGASGGRGSPRQAAGGPRPPRPRPEAVPP